MQAQVHRGYNGVSPTVLLWVAGVTVELTDDESLVLARQLIDVAGKPALEELDH